VHKVVNPFRFVDNKLFTSYNSLCYKEIKVA
jgi:hypothetical protein